LISALVGGEWSASRPDRFTPDTHRIGGWAGPRAGLDDVEKIKFLILPGLELRSFGRPARNQSLYRLRYPGYKEEEKYRSDLNNGNRQDSYSRNISVGIVMGWTAGVRLPAGAGYFALLHSNHTGPGTHPASYPMGTGDSILEGTAAGAWS
jgi:hypothetical protein